MKLEPIMNAEEFYNTLIAPHNADKSFVVPAWVTEFAERYADYLSLAFLKVKLQSDLQNADMHFQEAKRKIPNYTTNE